jgi:hypothetical protein
MAAGALKLCELAFETQDAGTPTLLMIIFSDAELLGGVWMVSGFDVERTRWCAAAGFAGLAASSLLHALAGKCSCGCFGSLTINPWLVLVFDLAAVAGLLGARPPRQAWAIFPASPLHWLGLGALTLLIGVGGWQQADLVTIDGTVKAAGRPLVEATVIFTGASGKFVLRTDHDGNFRLPFIRPGLYAVSAPGRVGAPMPKTKQSDRRPEKKDAQRSGQRSESPSQPGGDDALLWTEIPGCSEHGKIIIF